MTDARAGAPAGAGAPGVASFGGIRLRAIDGGPLEGARLFRSASLSRITEHEAAFVVGGLGVRSIYDLRNRWEVASSPEPRIVGAKTLAFDLPPIVDVRTRLAVWWPASSASTAVRKSA